MWNLIIAKIYQGSGGDVLMRGDAGISGGGYGGDQGGSGAVVVSKIEEVG